MGSAAAGAGAKETNLCALLSADLLVGLGANAALGWWWPDPVAGLGIAVLAALEARRTSFAESLTDTPAVLCLTLGTRRGRPIVDGQEPRGSTTACDDGSTMTATAITDRKVTVVGGGPSGLMAAEMLARVGVTVAVYERMPTVGRKLQVAGRGGLNLTHSEPLEALVERYGPARTRLAPALGRFDNAALRAWCEGLGVATFVGTSGRVFPVGLRATTLLRAWLRRLDDLGVEVRTRHTWLGWDDDGALRFRDHSGATVTVESDACVLALGGASWPRTGSDGAWVSPLEDLGVAVTPLRPSNCGFVVGWSEVFRSRFTGTPVKDVALCHGATRARGDIVVTDHGVEGGPIYALSSRVRDEIDASGHAVVHIDVMPDAPEVEVIGRLARRRPKDSAATGLGRAGLAPVVVALLREATGNRLPTNATELSSLLKALPLRLEAPQPIARAISTAGGVALDAIDDRYMLRARPGTFVAGEMLDWEAPTGGYLLQAALSTGVAAGEGALAWLAERLPATDRRP